MIDNDDNWTGERCVVPTPVPAEHKLTAVWKLSDAPSKGHISVALTGMKRNVFHGYMFYNLLLQSTEER